MLWGGGVGAGGSNTHEGSRDRDSETNDRSRHYDYSRKCALFCGEEGRKRVAPPPPVGFFKTALTASHSRGGGRVICVGTHFLQIARPNALSPARPHLPPSSSRWRSHEIKYNELCLHIWGKHWRDFPIDTAGPDPGTLRTR